VVGGGRAHGVPAGGNFLLPAIVADVEAESPLAREEIVGPVVTAFRFRDDERVN
jgi:acyl-CoA reductase-like NAD-dependent aldehyde dehydrogenase